MVAGGDRDILPLLAEDFIWKVDLFYSGLKGPTDCLRLEFSTKIDIF